MFKVLLFVLLFGSVVPLVAQEEHLSGVKNAVMLITAVPAAAIPVSANAVTSASASATDAIAMMPLPLEEAAEMSGLRLTALIGGIAALVFTFYQALGRRPNSARR